jgi:hypothetical protein
MPESYTPAVVEHTTITVPVGSDKPSGALFSLPLKELGDQIEFVRGQQAAQITALQGALERGWADFAIDDTVAVGNAWLPLVVASGATGAGSSNVTRTAHTGGPTGHYIQLGDPDEDDATGLWEVEVEIHGVATSTGVKGCTLFRHDGSSDPTVDATAVRHFIAEGSGVVLDTEEFTIRGTFRDFIAGPIGSDAPRFSLKWDAGAAATLGTSLDAPRVYVTQLGHSL